MRERAEVGRKGWGEGDDVWIETGHCADPRRLSPGYDMASC